MTTTSTPHTSALDRTGTTARENNTPEKEGFWNERRVKIAKIVGTVAVISILTAALFFIPGAPLAFYGTIFAGATLFKLGMSMFAAKMILEAMVIFVPTGVAALVYKLVESMESAFIPISTQAPYHPRDLSLFVWKPWKSVASKLSLELTHAKTHMNDQKQQRVQDLPSFAELGNMKCDFNIHSQKEGLPPLQVGVAHAQGRKTTQEDVHIACSGKIGAGKAFHYDLFGIIDGHGGDATARFVKAHLQEEIEKALLRHDIRLDMYRGKPSQSDIDVWRALKEAFVQLDARIARESEFYYGKSGAVAVITLRIGASLWTANLGDCRAVLKAGDETIQLSVDAKPDMPRFKNGIEKRGGFVEEDENDAPRMHGIRLQTGERSPQLSCARAFGDKAIRGSRGHYVVSPRPKITKVDLGAYQDRPVHLIQACDGIWDVASTRDAASLVGTQDPEKAAASIVRAALNSGSTDNCSALVVRLAK